MKPKHKKRHSRKKEIILDPLDYYPATRLICGDYKCDAHARESIYVLKSLDIELHKLVGKNALKAQRFIESFPEAPKGTQCMNCHWKNIHSWVARRLKEQN